MTEPKIYSLDSSLIPDANPKDGFCVDLVRVGDYASLKADRDAQQKRADALAVENENQRDWINKCSELWDAGCDLDNLLGLIPETPATDAALAAIQARILPPNIAEIIDSGDLETICYGHEHPFAERIRLALYSFRQPREAK